MSISSTYTIPIKVGDTKSQADVPSRSAGVRGLIITARHDYGCQEGEWVITHKETGKRLPGVFPSIAAARRGAKAAASFLDWTTPNPRGELTKAGWYRLAAEMFDAGATEK